MVSGFLGVLVGFVLMTLGAFNVFRLRQRPGILLLLWPASIAGLVHPSTPSDKILVALVEFGGNFILYGAIGTLIGILFRGRPAPRGVPQVEAEKQSGR